MRHEQTVQSDRSDVRLHREMTNQHLSPSATDRIIPQIYAVTAELSFLLDQRLAASIFASQGLVLLLLTKALTSYVSQAGDMYIHMPYQPTQ